MFIKFMSAALFLHEKPASNETLIAMSLDSLSLACWFDYQMMSFGAPTGSMFI